MNNAPVTGWQYIDGFKYYFNETSKLLTDLEPIVGNSGVPYQHQQADELHDHLCTGRRQRLHHPGKDLPCLTGPDTPGPGTFSSRPKYRWRDMNHGIFTQYTTRIYKNYLIHSILYSRPDPMTLNPADL